MREILFRGKRIDNNEWVYGSLVGNHIFGYNELDKYNKKEDLFICKAVVHEVIPETIGQYTGLKDKNGVKIFEGDIGIRKLSKKYAEWVDYWHVVFDEKSAGFITVLIKEFRVDKVVDVDPKLNSFSKRFNEIEVVGNIHDKQ